MQNGVMFQTFHWFGKGDGSHYRELKDLSSTLAERGITSVWIPPAFKGAGGTEDRGYAVYDLYDLGEFEQKGTRRTRYGTREELHEAIEALRAKGIRVYADIVFNQRCGGDEVEDLHAHFVNPENRNEVSSEPRPIRAYTRFNFPGRGDKYSPLKWHGAHFIATDHDALNPDENGIYLFSGKTFSGDVSYQYGNYDFLMGCDVDTYHPEVFDELVNFGRWFLDATKVDGVRLDALKHIPSGFFKEWLDRMRGHLDGRDLFAVGEYWAPEATELIQYLDQLEGKVHLFDVPLHYAFMRASKEGNAFDLSSVFDGSLVKTHPLNSVTFVDNHDTQPGSSLESWVEPWFKPLAYALILLRKDGYPCVFGADYFGHEDERGVLHAHKALIDVFLDARRKYNHGDEHDFFDHPNCIAWLRTGDDEHPGKMVVIMSNGEPGTKRIETGKPSAKFRDATGHSEQEIVTDEHGAAEFTCPGGSLSVWLEI